MTDPVVDNRRRRVGDFLRERIGGGANLSIVSAYFTIYAYQALREALEGAGRTRFLYGEPRGAAGPDPSGADARFFRLTEADGIELGQALAQKALARACAAWIRDRVDIRSVERANFLHGKLYHVAGADGADAALAGSSNFTRRGLGFGAAPNLELNLEVRDAQDRAALLGWFDALWNDPETVHDVKNEVLAALERLGAAYGPEFVYYKTLFHVFEDRLARRGRADDPVDGVHLHDTAIWEALYDFQRDGATNAINRLLRYNGCILADSVGLGKTWTALAVIRFFEARNERVLVLCPKKLEDNWTRYAAWAGHRDNPFAADRLGYTVLAHTDLSRYRGKAGAIDLASFNWGAFDLIVIDESHNFRNEGRDRTNESGEIVHHSRYNRLMEEVLKGGVRTKVLMLSATPVNTSLRDLRNQIYLMTEKRGDAFREALGIRDIQNVFGVAQRAFQEWEQRRRQGAGAGKAELLERLGADFLALLDAVTIARSRSHIRRFYPKVAEEIGGFPRRARPANLHPPADTQGELSYDDVHERIGAFRLAVYNPSRYLLDTSELDAEKRRLRFDQRDRERWLIGMMRVNLLKRLESSPHAFWLTLKRILDKMEDLDRRIEAWLARGGAGEIDARPDTDEEDDESAVGRGRRYRLDGLALERWRRDLAEDREVFEDLRRRAGRVTVERDAKLAELKRVLRNKIEDAPADKDGRRNRKALVFTAFADTARYLYENLADWARTEFGVRAALVTGGDGNRTTVGGIGFADILKRFAPKAQQAGEFDEEIDLLIATDCLSEGQNLQDCDLAVNYDIHWNPVRLLQRFGRIDRLGGRQREVRMVNFWPTADLDRYLDLRNRVEARMALADAAATGLDDPLAEEAAVQGELAFRDEQLKRLRDEILDLEDTDAAVGLNDLTLDDFMADLLNYLQRNRAALEAAPFGIYAIADTRPRGDPPPEPARPGAIFCLRQKTAPDGPTPNRLAPYFLVHVRDHGTVRYGFRQARQCLALFRALAAGRPEADAALENAFDRETDQGRRMQRYEALLEPALRSIAGGWRQAEKQRMKNDRGAKRSKRSERPEGVDDFELVTWLVIADKRPATANGPNADAE